VVSKGKAQIQQELVAVGILDLRIRFESGVSYLSNSSLERLIKLGISVSLVTNFSWRD